MSIRISDTRDWSFQDIIDLYRSNKWSAADKPEQLFNGLKGSHYVVSAWSDDRLVGLGNAISDGHLVVYFPHILVHPDFHRTGVGKRIVDQMHKRYMGFHMQTLTADVSAVPFYEAQGYAVAGRTVPMWIYDGSEH